MPNRPMTDWDLYLCPACSKPSGLTLNTDRFFHADGSENVECWAAIARGDVEYPLHPVVAP